MKKITTILRAAVIIACGVVVLSLCGCATDAAERGSSTSYKKLDNALLMPCYVSPLPVDKKTFLAQNRDVRMEIMASYATTLLGDMDVCNIRMGEAYIANNRLDAVLNPKKDEKDK